jgi:signal transduction histidine kinase
MSTQRPFNLNRTLLVVALSTVYLAIGILDDRRVKRQRRLSTTVSYLVVEIVLGTWIIFLSGAQSWLILLPMAGAAMEYFPRRWALFTCVVVWFAQILPFYLLYGLETALIWSIPLAAANVFVATFTAVTVSEQKARADLAAAHQQLREYAAQVEELAVVQERNRLAREIHDGLGHYLTAINVQIRAAQSVARSDPAQTAASLDNAYQLSQEALADVRRSISALRADPSSARPLPETLGRMLAEAHSRDLDTHLVVTGTPRALDGKLELALYRLVQEGLTNVRKHSQANRVDLSLEYLPASIRVTLRDNGVGSDQPQGGFGLMGLRERADLLGGRVEVRTALGHGFEIQMELPG